MLIDRVSQAANRWKYIIHRSLGEQAPVVRQAFSLSWVGGKFGFLLKQIESLNLRTYGEGLYPSNVFEGARGAFVLLLSQVRFILQKTHATGVC